MASTYTPIATTTLGAQASNITFSSIPATYTDLVVVLTGRDSYGAQVASSIMQFNGDTNTNYSYTFLRGNGSAASSGRGSNTTFAYIGELAGSSAASGIYTPSIIQIQNYANTNVYKTCLVRDSSANGIVDAIVTMWRSTSAINSIKLIASTNYEAGTTATLYGIKAA